MKKKMVVILTFLITKTMQAQDWTWLYKKVFTTQERTNNNERTSLVFVKSEISTFTQLIFSWNSLRPSNGYFTFWSQVRNSETKKWYPWHKMVEWGMHRQQSFLEKRKDATSYHHVRLEVPKNHAADAMRIKVEAHEGADLSLLHAFCVSTSDLNLFKAEALTLVSFPSHHIKGLPLFSQMELEHPKKEVLCSPTSCSMLISYFLKKKIDPVIFAQGVYDVGLDAYGSWPFNTAHAFECCLGSMLFYVVRLASFAQLYEYIRNNFPVVVSVRGPLKNAPLEYKQGHLLVVVGWDKEQQCVICHDPAFSTNDQALVTYKIYDFLQAWERSRRLAYVPEPYQY